MDLLSLSLEELQDLAEDYGLEVNDDPNNLIWRIRAHDLMRKKAIQDAPKLDGLQEVIAALEAAESPYVCVGTVPLSSFTILVASEPSEKAPTTYTPVHFPLKNETAIQPLIDASKQASFGHGSTDALDTSYGKALALRPDRFAITPPTALEPHILGIVQSISETLIAGAGPRADSRKIVAVLDKLNVYSEGDDFKGHVDTTKSPNMFGTLLINLPVAHEGGQLIVRAPEASSTQKTGDSSVKEGHGLNIREEYMTNWGKGSSIDWIAFDADREHEVFPVTRGNRLTLSYTLALVGPLDEEEDHPVDIEAFAGSKDLTRQRLVDALKAPGVLTKARPRLCFYLQHKYPIDCESPDLWSISSRLKGRDAVLYHALHAMDAKITLHLVFPTSYRAEEDGELVYCSDSDEEALTFILPEGVTPKPQWSPAERDLEGLLELARARTPEQMRVVEVNANLAQFVKLSYAAYGNQPQHETIYGSVCFIATLAGAEKRKRADSNQ